jgi:hypothetical protein
MNCETCIYVGQYHQHDVYICSDARDDYILLPLSGIETEGYYNAAPTEIQDMIKPYMDPTLPRRERFTTLYWATLKLRS